MQGYYDFREAAYSISERSAWILLGPKGSGKSASLEHLRILWKHRHDRFVTVWELDSFPLQEAAAIASVSGSETHRAQASWEFLLLLKVMESIDKDLGRGSTVDFDKLFKALRDRGLVDADSGVLVRELTKTTFTFDLKLAKLSRESTREKGEAADVSLLIRRALSSLSLENRHLVALDGLDSYFFAGGSGWTSLSGLIEAIGSLNNFFHGERLPVSVVASLRSDHFDVINSQNSNKLKGQSIHLDWNERGIGPENHLWRLVQAKVAVGHPEVKDLVRDYLSEPMHSPTFPTVAQYLLSYTRLLPRDLIALLRYVQGCHGGSSPVSEDAAKAATARYAQEYFVGEVMNNLSGVLPEDLSHRVADFREALRAAPSRLFDFSYMTNELEGVLTPVQVKDLLRRMFETGGVGISNPIGGRRFTDFVFRRVSGAAFTHRADFMLHDALTRAWNRPWHTR